MRRMSIRCQSGTVVGGLIVVVLVLKQANRGCGVSRDFGATVGAEWSW